MLQFIILGAFGGLVARGLAWPGMEVGAPRPKPQPDPWRPEPQPWFLRPLSILVGALAGWLVTRWVPIEVVGGWWITPIAAGAVGAALVDTGLQAVRR